MIETSDYYEKEPCGCGVRVITVAQPTTTAHLIVLRCRHAVHADCPHDHTLGAKLVAGGRRLARRESRS